MLKIGLVDTLSSRGRSRSTTSPRHTVSWRATSRSGKIVVTFRAVVCSAAAVFHRLNGRKLLIRGNHNALAESLPWDGPIRDIARIHVQDPGMPKARGVWLSHYAHRTWPHMHRGDLHLHRHSHGSLPAIPNSLDVGVDCWDWTPVALHNIRVRLAENVLLAGGSP